MSAGADGTKVIAGRYELGDRLGLGGMSTVVVAFDTRLERYVAVKLLAEHLADDAQFVARFRREAMAAARLVHPNIVQVYDFGLDDASGRHYIVMERIVGPSGANVLRDRGRLPVEEAVDWIAQACRGLQYAHRNGLVHRDVKPGNLLLSEGDGTVKLADFGIAKAANDESSITQVGSVLGTAAYLAPEQAAGEEAGPAADLYGLGVVAYQLLSGRLPYEAASLTELALKQQREVPAPLHHLDPSIPPALSVAVERALALSPRRRYESADAMRAAVLDGAKGIGPDADATRVVGGLDDDPTSATTVFAGEPGSGPMVVPREPRAPRRAPPATPP
ncbi:MAG TPA: protein kinase, partial [Baekduia sp.]|nr:protein kinase [Baekduia sp.]